MPIYAYLCKDCGFEKDVLQKFSDAPLTVCPNCGKESFVKKLTAPAFQLKGSGWYATDFRDGAKKPADKPSDASAGAEPAPASGGSAETAAKPADSGSNPAPPVAKSEPAKSDAKGSASGSAGGGSTPAAS